MDFEQQLRTAFAPCRAPPELRASILGRASAEGGATQGTGRNGGRTILIGTILAVVAAAATLVWLSSSKPEAHLVAEVVETAPAVEPVAAAGDQPLPDEEASPEPEALWGEVPKELPSPIKPFTVQLLPPINEGEGPAARAAIDSYFTAVVNSLRAVPGLVLTLSDTRNPTGDPLPDYRLTIIGMGIDAKNFYQLTLRGNAKDVLEGKRKLTWEQRDRNSFSDFSWSLSGRILPTCTPAVDAEGADCKTPASIAADMVDLLRKREFPLDPLLRLQMQKSLLDASLDPGQRLKALMEFGSLKSPTYGAALQDPVVVRGAISLATTAIDPAIRAQAWRAMRGSRNPDLVNPVTASLLQERDPEVRMQAVILLQDFSSDSRAREALEVIAREESRPLVRALAARALQGEATWNAYIAASLKDSSRSDAERIEAFIYHVAPPGPSPGSHIYTDVLGSTPDLLDDEAIQALGQLLPRAAGKSQDINMILHGLIGQLGVVKTPAMTSMFLGLLQQAADIPLKYTLINELGGRLDEPGVREALGEVSSKDPLMRDIVTNALKSAPAGR